MYDSEAPIFDRRIHAAMRLILLQDAPDGDITREVFDVAQDASTEAELLDRAHRSANQNLDIYLDMVSDGRGAERARALAGLADELYDTLRPALTKLQETIQAEVNSHGEDDIDRYIAAAADEAALVGVEL